MISQAGNWFSYMAVLVLVQKLDPGSAQAISGVIIARYLPATLLAPVLGNVADSRDKRLGIVACSVVAGGCSALLCVVRRGELLPVVYLLLIIQARSSPHSDPTPTPTPNTHTPEPLPAPTSSSARGWRARPNPRSFLLAWLPPVRPQATAVTLYDLFRRSLIPLLVPPADLQLSNTLDGLLWSLMLAVGASLGGFCVAAVGVSASLVIDALSFAVSAAVFFQLAPSGAGGAAAGARRRRRPRAAEGRADSREYSAHATAVELAAASGAATAAGEGASAAAPPHRELTRDSSSGTVIERPSSDEDTASADGRSSDGGGGGDDDNFRPTEKYLGRRRSGLEMFAELLSYLRRRPHMAVLCLLKSSGSSVWCAAEILQARAALPLQHLAPWPSPLIRQLPLNTSTLSECPALDPQQSGETATRSSPASSFSSPPRD